MSSIHTLASYIPLWIQVTRLDRPVGWIVLLWPTWIALTAAGYAAGEFRLDMVDLHPRRDYHTQRRLCGE